METALEQSNRYRDVEIRAPRGTQLTAKSWLTIECLQASHGVLAPGKVADFVAWDIAHPAELAYWIGGELPKRVIRHGEPVCATALG